ncbi:MAG: VWA domain-containing protein [Proteobacteria bacterium]|nr:VWA domain-containing protein [Pseudomonadota bacterium]
MDASSLDLDWEQALYRAARSLWRIAFPVSEEVISEAAVALSDRQASLRVLGRVLGGERVRVLQSAGTGGVRGADLLLPIRVDLSDNPAVNAEVFTYRTVIGALLVEQGPCEGTWMDHYRRCIEVVESAAEALPHLAEMHESCCRAELAARPDLDGLKGVARVQERAIHAALQGQRPWDLDTMASCFDKALATTEVTIWGRAIEVGFEASDGSHGGDAPPAQDSSESEVLDVEDIRLLDVGEEDVVELPVHVFEKVETLDEWSGGARPMDGSDDLDDHLEALDEVDLRDLIRGGEQARSVIKADVVLDLEIPDVGTIAPSERGIPYPEWNYKKAAYREDWTMVYPTVVPRGGDDWAARATEKWRKEIDDLRLKLRVLKDSLRPRPRQTEGEEIDIDAVVDELSARKAKHGGDARLYRRLHRRDWDMATTVLLDLSLSSDGWVDGRRVLDVARESLLVLGEVMQEFDLDLRIIAFASQTRNQVRAWDVLHWDEPWAVARGRIGLLHPQGYTRIGPAIRHATADLRSRVSRRKLLILLSDGKPTDYDKYEGRYGVADVRRAVLDARSEGIRVHALAIDSQAQDVLPVMLGRGSWDLLPSADLLPPVLTTLTARMAMR